MYVTAKIKWFLRNFGGDGSVYVLLKSKTILKYY